MSNEKYFVGDVVQFVTGRYKGKQAIIVKTTYPGGDHSVIHIKDGNGSAWHSDEEFRFIRLAKRGELEKLQIKYGVHYI